MTRTSPINQRVPKADGRAGVVRQATVQDLAGIVRIHQKAFSHFFLTRLGGDFLLDYYSLVLQYRSGIVLVGEGSGVLEGFACGFVDPAEFYQLMWRSRWAFVLPVLSALVRNPSLVTKVVYGVQRIQTPASVWPARSCELSSIAVAPEAGGNGLGKALMRAFLKQAQSMNAHCVYLTTDADGNDAANAFYRDAGFQHTRRFLQRKGRWMNEYVINGAETANGCETHS
jgi:ribosomal protein S18 acetylase RimI-like enzyme